LVIKNKVVILHSQTVSNDKAGKDEKDVHCDIEEDENSV
jgi:hypothetical protein